MLTVACVEWGNYQGRGRDYVARLQAMAARHLTVPHEFRCIRPDAVTGDLDGWWNKVLLFRPGLFKGRVLYLDLDTIVVGTLDELVRHKGLLHLDEWGWKEKVYGSGVMVWDAGEHEEIYSRFTPAVAARLRGDQDWMTELGGWGALPPGICCSYKYHCAKRGRPAAGASVVCFHGPIKPHTLPEGHWVREYWRA